MPASFVLVAVVLGLVLGAMTCAAGLTDGHLHGTEAATVVDGAAPDRADHADHVAGSHMYAAAESAPAPHDETRSHDQTRASSAENHPGMACVASVDLRFVPLAPVPASASCGIGAVETAAEWSADVEPPVPRPT